MLGTVSYFVTILALPAVARVARRHLVHETQTSKYESGTGATAGGGSGLADAGGDPTPDHVDARMHLEGKGRIDELIATLTEVAGVLAVESHELAEVD